MTMTSTVIAVLLAVGGGVIITLPPSRCLVMRRRRWCCLSPTSPRWRSPDSRTSHGPSNGATHRGHDCCIQVFSVSVWEPP